MRKDTQKRNHLSKKRYICPVYTRFIMKKHIITVVILLLSNLLHAQIAQWIIPPHYDHIDFASGADLIVTDSLNAKIFWDYSGKRLFATTDTIYPFAEGYAVTVNDSSLFTGFYDVKGHFTPFTAKKRKIANDYPYFSGGYVIVKRNRYYFVDTRGNYDGTKHLRLYPFSNGYAVCKDYENPGKKKGIINYYMDENKNMVPLIYKGKTIDPAKVDFISSVNDSMIGIVVYKDDLYYFEGAGKEIRPLGIPNPKNKAKTIQAELESGLPFTEENPQNVMYAKCGKDNQVTIRFNDLLVPTDIYFNTERHRYGKEPEKPQPLTSSLRVVNENGKCGFALGSSVVIPPQFDEIVCCFDNYAFVKQDGKYGLLQNIENTSFALNLNDNDAVPFRHQWFETKLRIDMPTILSPDKTDVEVSPDCGYTIDKISKSVKTTASGNRAEYDCKLAIPTGITADQTEYTYPIQITYDGIRILPIQQTLKAWHYNCFGVTVDTKGIEVDKIGEFVSFPYTLSVERYSDKEFFQLDIQIVPDYLNAEVEKLTETTGICTIPLSQLDDGTNDFDVRVIEQGCPPVDFSYELTFKKPKTKRKPTVKDIQIKKY